MTDAEGELRFDALTRQWVNVVAHRQTRPNLPESGCPFCVGGLEAPNPYDVRVFENRWPAYSPGDAVALDPDAGALPAVGACEVVLFSPEHDASLSTLPHAQVRKVIDVWAERTDALLARPEVEYVLVFENRGREVGATIDHPHGQIYAYPFVPPIPAREAEIARSRGCALCDEVPESLVVATAGDWTAWVPYASEYAYGVRIAPRAHVGSLPHLDAGARTRRGRVAPARAPRAALPSAGCPAFRCVG
jgi:UDPglucose--hexose-1-phosphate uridylyltransferase